MNKPIINKQTVIFKNKPAVIGRYALVGPKEGEGPLKDYFKHVLNQDKFGEKTFEKAEKKMLETVVFSAIEDARLKLDEVGALLSGDLLNQIISSSFAARKFRTSFIGLFGACSTMAESLALGACLVDGGYFNTVACATGSHFSTAERQFRGPIELGSQRPPYAQWTVTAAACTVLSAETQGNGCVNLNCNKQNDNAVPPNKVTAHKKTKNKTPRVTAATFGKVIDYGVSDVFNMGAAMAPAAMATLTAHFADTGTAPADYDHIFTGDLGKLGSDILRDLMAEKGYQMGQNYSDCGAMIFHRGQNTFQGGSGCGCSAAVLNSYIMDKLQDGTFKKVLFAATGALMSPTSSQQGESIPGISHAVVLESD